MYTAIWVKHNTHMREKDKKEGNADFICFDFTPTSTTLFFFPIFIVITGVLAVLIRVCTCVRTKVRIWKKNPNFYFQIINIATLGFDRTRVKKMKSLAVAVLVLLAVFECAAEANPRSGGTSPEEISEQELVEGKLRVLKEKAQSLCDSAKEITHEAADTLLSSHFTSDHFLLQTLVLYILGEIYPLNSGSNNILYSISETEKQLNLLGLEKISSMGPVRYGTHLQSISNRILKEEEEKEKDGSSELW